MNYELRITNYELLFVKILSVLLIFGGSCFLARAQSTSQSFPTAVTANEISGSIKARDLGDARLTSYFYVFGGAQGDVFINVLANNFNGNIDVFTADGLKPLTKIVVFADASDNETGRVVYLRKPERLLLRVEGRTPNDDAATFRIKFAGSFQALAGNENANAPLDPKVASGVDSEVRVNSVGTIIAAKPKPVVPKQTIAEIKQTEKVEVKELEAEQPKKNDSDDVVSQISVETGAEKSIIAETGAGEKKERTIEVGESKNKLEVTITENSQEEKQVEDAAKLDVLDEKSSGAETPKTEIAKVEKTKKPAKPAKKAIAAPKGAKSAKAAELNAALENIRLIVLMKDGSKIEKPMSEILRVGVDKGVLTVIAKDGTISRYSILDVAKMTIE